MIGKRVWLILLFYLACSVLPAQATTYTVKAAGGGTFTTIQACANATVAGDTCTIFAGTYNEFVTLKAGTAGNIITFTVNPGDTVIVRGFMNASYTTVDGFEITDPSLAKPCIDIPTNSTQYHITNNNIHNCSPPGTPGVQEHVGVGNNTTFGYIQNNKFSWIGSPASSVPCSANPCGSTAWQINGDYHLIEGNDESHVIDGGALYGQFNVVRKNTMHDTNNTDWLFPSGEAHIDFVESQCSTGVLCDHVILYEGNTERRNLNTNGSDAHSWLLQTNGSGFVSDHVIIRFNSYAHMGTSLGNGYSFLCGQIGLANSGWQHLKSYNNTSAFLGINNDSTETFYVGCTNGAELNNIFYYGVSMSQGRPYEVDGASSSGFVARSNLAFCTVGICNFSLTRTAGGAFTNDPGNLTVDPKFANPAADDFHLQATSPARGAGSYLTTANGSGSGSTSLIVNDAAFFQDGMGLTGVQPDWIRVGASITAQISSINYDTNTITLVSPISWSNGAPVYLYKDSSGNAILTGPAPDIGAFPYTIAPPNNLSVVVR